MLENVLDFAYQLEEKANTSSQQAHGNIIPNIANVNDFNASQRPSKLIGPSATVTGTAVGRITRQFKKAAQAVQADNFARQDVEKTAVAKKKKLVTNA